MDDMFDVFGQAPDPDASSDEESIESHSSAQKAKSSAKASPSSLKRKAKSSLSDSDQEMQSAGSQHSTDSSDAESDHADSDEADADSDLDNDSDNDNDNNAQTSSQKKHNSKRRKKQDEAEAVLTDTFETAAERQVDAAPDADDGSGAASGTGESGEAGAAEPIKLSHNIAHQVALPPDLEYEYIPISQHKPPAEPARTYPFKLDPFQAYSVASIERDESVLVAAHTSAGKTVVAEYAIAQCLKRNQRVIYTSPIKALSNQKYRDFKELFGDVGLITGDVTTDPTASCLVMTTEILRSMLYRGSEIMREVAWVIFDEVHYLREKTRGVVWEETIILLPDKVRYVFLSATIPNAFEFAEWIAKIHKQACHVVYTDFRPTPLRNYFYPAGSDCMLLVVDEKKNFKEANFNQAIELVEQGKKALESGPKSAGGGGNKKKGGRNNGASDTGKDVKKIVKMIITKRFDPAIIFSFSKRECESLAMQISQYSFNDDSERDKVRLVFRNAIETLPKADRELPGIKSILPLLERGIGVHHSGLFPILREVIEILFQESLIKVLFATETFAIGLNMPAKTVVFTSVMKFDGTGRRPLSASEYVQMSGRAGRRGLDLRGIVITLFDDFMDPDVARAVVVGEHDRLVSAFYLGYTMVLNLLRIESVSPEFMLKNCFHQFQNTASLPALENKMMELQHERDNLVISDEAAIKEYYTIRQQINVYRRDMLSVMQLPEICKGHLTPGRLVRIFDPASADDSNLHPGNDYGWGVVVNLVERRAPKMGEPDYPPQEAYLIDVVLPVDAESPEPLATNPGLPFPTELRPQTPGGKMRLERVSCLLTCVKALSQIKLKPKALDTLPAMGSIKSHLHEIMRRFPDGLPLLDPIDHMEIRDDSFKKLVRKTEVLEARLLTNPLHSSPLLKEAWEQYAAKARLTERIKEQKKAIVKANTIGQLDELKARMRVLRRLDFINENEVVQLKGRVACEISSTEGHELLLAELLFDRFFNELSPELCAAVLSIFVFDEKVTADPLKEPLDKPFREAVIKARMIAKVSQESKLDIDVEAYVGKLKWQLMDTVYLWCQGSQFIDICKLTDAYEGSLIRHFRRLEELLRQMAEASRVMGSEDLTKKFEESLGKLKRDIVAAQSLYL
ncbi:ATP-dependent RNA helicase mtr4 [Ceratocystis fimbriata CBS 114723]|uniref:ATP-dependent RNA helicase mtr4 n=1 Tax=Ceratocystis fimbriata CBS 114723 TaxID=1035309 RepID=A0A2C5X0T1_9PEZI|nr:ATP-dependent RNA helicase mtr4 [Ceratocystis fimbriata CBS 114723]